VSAGAAILLLVFMFAMKWYGVDGIPGRSALYRTVDAWDVLTLLRWLMLLTILAALVAPVVQATGRSRHDPSAIVAALATATTALLCYRVLIEPPSPAAVLDQKLGAFLGLLSAAAIAIGAYEAFTARRAPGALGRRSTGTGSGVAEGTGAR
jgi:putative exporter of polyketide antibiotics